MKKKVYIQPVVEQAEMQPQGVICTSPTYGGPSDNAGDGSSTIELP